MGSQAQVLLRKSKDVLRNIVPAGIEIQGSGGVGNKAAVPWIAFLDPDFTDSPQRGIYVVYLWSADMDSLYLCLSQGVTDISKVHKKDTIKYLREEASKMRALISGQSTELISEISLKDKGRLPIQYEAATIVAKKYLPKSLPEEETLRSDLHQFLEMYDEVVASKKEHLVSSPGEWIAGLPDLTTSRNSIADEKPKWNIDFQSDRTTSGSEIIFNVPARTQRVSRRHVAVLDGLRALLREHGWETSTPHPCDLVATKAERDERLLIEVKVVRSGDKALVAREAIGQLLDYSYSFKVQLGNHKLVGAFSEPIDDHYINLLAHLNISAWWFDPDEQSWKSRGATW